LTLGKYGIPIDDITKLAKFVNNLKECEYNVEKTITESLNLEVLRVTQGKQKKRPRTRMFYT